jgi:hypothetical protein
MVYDRELKQIKMMQARYNIIDLLNASEQKKKRES